jgi:hypothetical protein
MFERNTAQRCSCDFRLTQDGLPYVLDQFSKRRIHVSAEDFCQFIVHGTILLSTLRSSTGELVAALEPGPVIAILSPEYGTSVVAVL